MPLLPPSDRTTPEAILVMAQYGGGKTEDWATIATAYREYGNTGHFHVLSTEYERVLASMQGRKGWQDNTTIYDVHDWPSLLSASHTIDEKARGSLDEKGIARLDSQDFLVVDVIGNPHYWARDKYMDDKHGKTYEAFQDAGGSSSEVQSHEWRQMDRIYLGEWYNPIVTRFPGHVFLCAQSKPFAEGAWAPKPGSTVKEVFGRIRQQPVGHNELARLVHTVIYQVNSEKGIYKFTILKDKYGREQVEAQTIAPLGDNGSLGFVVSYLMSVGGWEVTK